MKQISTFDTKVTKTTAWFAYIVILFEMIYMSTPFAVFFYSVYGMPLKALNESGATAWLVQNIFPHFTQTESLLINILLYISLPLMGIGLVMFIIAFVQLYWAKFRKKGAVVGGLYRFIRHPQYAAWAIFGLGMAIFWSRMIVVITYVSMLFVYYFLAKREEQECLEKYGEPYRTYLQRTGRFLPKFFMSRRHNTGSILPRTGLKRTAALIAVYLITIGCTMGLGLGLRSYSLSQISSISETNKAAISTTPMAPEQMKTILSIATNNKAVMRELQSIIDTSRTQQLIYIVPEEWQIPELSMEEEGEHSHERVFNPTNHFNPTDFDQSRYKVLFSKAVVDKDVRGKAIISSARFQKPLLLVKVNLDDNRVTEIARPPVQGKYADIPVPLF